MEEYERKVPFWTPKVCDEFRQQKLVIDIVNKKLEIASSIEERIRKETNNRKIKVTPIISKYDKVELTTKSEFDHETKQYIESIPAPSVLEFMFEVYDDKKIIGAFKCSSDMKSISFPLAAILNSLKEEVIDFHGMPYSEKEYKLDPNLLKDIHGGMKSLGLKENEYSEILEEKIRSGAYGNKKIEEILSDLLASCRKPK